MQLDNINLSEMLPSRPQTFKVARADSQGRNKQQNRFQKSPARKKKKENPEYANRPKSELPLSSMSHKSQTDIKNADKCSHTNESVRSKLIDIRV